MPREGGDMFNMDRVKPPVMNAAAIWKFVEQWCSGWCYTVVGRASDHDVVQIDTQAAARLD